MKLSTSALNLICGAVVVFVLVFAAGKAWKKS